MSSSINTRSYPGRCNIKTNGRKDVGRLDRRHPRQYFAFKKKFLFVYKRKKRRKIRAKKIEIRRRNEVGFLLKERPKHLNAEFLINNPTVFYKSCSFTAGRRDEMLSG
jgi:hypothetical protein